ncbi:MAG: D-aminoacylase [Kutzneria sp.]|nr:D-aminoacylase [Kutzneria sp.]
MTGEHGAGGSVVIRDATIVDGTGAAGYPGDVVVEDGVIQAIAPPHSLSSDRISPRIDAGGLVVCPGFIDVHSHADEAPLLTEDDLAKISQGVTTEVTGNCGTSLAPVAANGDNEFLRSVCNAATFRYEHWRSVAELFTIIDRRRGVTNSCPLIGHGELRLAVMGPVSREATAEDVRAMGALLAEGLEAGAFGMSTGLIYPPGLYSNTEELAALAAYLPPGRVYATHMRNEGSGLLESIDEALVIGRRAGCRVQISHLKSAGMSNWGGVARALEVLDAARADGVPVTQDVYPYDAAATSMRVCLPPWVHDGGSGAMRRRLHDPSVLSELRRQVEEPADDASWENIIASAGYERIVVAAGDHRFAGMTLKHIADHLQVEPFDALIHVLMKEDFDSVIAVFDMSEQDMETALRSPFTAIGSDGGTAVFGGLAHPRQYGTFPRLLGRYVRDRGVLDMPEAIRRMTSLPASIFGVPGRGTIAIGKVADLVCFDPAEIGHSGDFSNPAVPPTGIAWVMQAGHVAMRHGRWAGTRRGSRLVPE